MIAYASYKPLTDKKGGNKTRPLEVSALVTQIVVSNNGTSATGSVSVVANAP
jgi:hypothetical protein